MHRRWRDKGGLAGLMSAPLLEGLVATAATVLLVLLDVPVLAAIFAGTLIGMAFAGYRRRGASGDG